jgi:outer membrane protein OmpA-like peptidoglycan-associated protein
VRFASDDREHRRGLVLGLTMAEILLLLLFLLLLALGARVADQQKELARANATIDTLAPIFASLSSDGKPSDAVVRNAAAKLAHATQLEKENEQLSSELKAANDELSGWKSAAKLAREINPDDPPIATVRRALEQSRGNQAMLKVLQKKAEAYDKLASAAKSISPEDPPESTIASSLESARRALKAKSDAEVGKGVRETVAVLRDTEQRLGKRLMTAFGDKLPAWKAEFDEKSLTLRFHNPDLLFEQGSANLRPGFTAILAQLFPDYLKTLYDFRDDIEEVRIEGHTSTEWAKGTPPLDAYFFNMGLSQDRTRAVLEYGLTKTGAPKDTLTWAQQMITANGLSSSRIVSTPTGEEDKEGSRRVEFRVLMRAKQRLMQLVEP